MSEANYLGEHNNPTVVLPRRRRLQDRVPIDAITADARQAHPGRAALGLIGGLLFMAGWVSRKIFGILFLSGSWCFSAIRIGWRSAAGEPLGGPDIPALLAENDRLRKELGRLQVSGM